MIKIIAGGKKNVGWVAEACAEYEKRLRKPFDVLWQFVDEDKLEAAILKCDARDLVILLDERGEIWDSPNLSKRLSAGLTSGAKVVLVIGGAYGVSEAARERANSIWSLSRLVFPHQICRLLVTEQIYRAQEIYVGRPYHHA
ncbi:23S rRNA (pseudouridine(1915)-N(3))-methyltransferase RlmH [Candidatus Saccharibacteria bacterium]|nr:23S rRNA (pseudouridine(1915)-N(3))-methyltransferase RlmH [Candidatus Saccharibacteria bacterium]